MRLLALSFVLIALQRVAAFFPVTTGESVSHCSVG